MDVFEIELELIKLYKKGQEEEGREIDEETAAKEWTAKFANDFRKLWTLAEIKQ